MKQLYITLFLLFYTVAYSKQNCNIYKWENNTECYKACRLYGKGGSQGSRSSQKNYDRVIELCPTYDDAYWAKAIPYLKRGDFINWRIMMDKAVELAPEKHLGYRGWCRYQFLKDYEGAIEDIEKLESLVNYDIGFCQNSDYHLNIAKALCYKGMGDSEKALEIIEQHLMTTEYPIGLYDYLHLGVLYLEKGDYSKAITALNAQIKENDLLADNYYYLGLAYKGLGRMMDYEKNIKKALEMYLNDYGRYDPYSTPMDKIFLEDIKREDKEMELG